MVHQEIKRMTPFFGCLLWTCCLFFLLAVSREPVEDRSPPLARVRVEEVSWDGYQEVKSVRPGVILLPRLLDLSLIQPPPQWIMLVAREPSNATVIITPFPARNAAIAGLGNLCFQFASVFGMSQSASHAFAFDAYHLSKLSNVFDLRQHPRFKFGFNPSINHLHVLPELPAATYFPNYTQSMTNLSVNVSVPGYLQSWKYFHPFAQSDLVKIFQFRPKIAKVAEQKLRTAQRKFLNATVTVGIHVRRGDIVEDEGLVKHGHRAAPVRFFLRAIDYFTSRFPSVMFVVATKDHSWTERHLGKIANVVILEPDSGIFSLTPDEATGVDLCILSLCDHLILSVGSFGWWAAYLNEFRRALQDAGPLKVVYYGDWPRKGSEFSRLLHAEDYFLPQWISM